MIPVLLLSVASMGQVTTSGIAGTVNSKGQGLEGASVVAIHVPTGSLYKTVSKKGGVFNLPGLRAGGPYKVTIEFVGFKSFVEEGFSIPLGAVYDINADLTAGLTELSSVVVTGTQRRRSAVDKVGTSTNIGLLQMSTLPTISRSITDFTRITPQANGTSFAGRDGRMNNVTVDGANLNNNFGLSSDLLPGGGNPISLDAFQEISVNISPYDVKQSGFTGAAVNAITKSGTNAFHGSVYGVYRNQNYNGLNVAGNKLNTPVTSSNKVYGATVGGPIIKNKLFFFVTGESEKSSFPGITSSPKGGSGNGTPSNVPVDSLAKLSSYLQSKYGFNPGEYDNFPAFASTNYKILAKIDWNINSVHKLTFKFNDFKNTGDNSISPSGGINGASSQSAIVTYSSSRFGTNSMGFSNINYQTIDKVRSYALELNSNYNGKFANQFITTLTKNNTSKSHNGPNFPFIDILGLTPGSKNNYLSAGNEPFNGNNNIVLNDVFNITDNFTYFAGKHTITAGATYEYQKVGNMFMAGSQGYYVYGSLDDFINNRAPKLFSLTYSLLPGVDAVYSANLRVGQLGGYIQDEVNISPRFKLTYGFRLDQPIYPEQPLANPAIEALTFRTKDGAPIGYSTGRWPKSTKYWSPRASFRWDVNGDKSQIIRGGTGIFTGRIPFVYLTNVPSNSGMYQYGALITATSDLNNFLFNPDSHAYNPFYNNTLNPAQFPKAAGSVAPGTFALTDPNFKFPQVWRSNLAVDQQLGNGWSYTFEALLTKAMNDPVQRNANQRPADGTVTISPTETRGYYSSTNARRYNTGITNATVLENTDKNMSFAFTGLIQKSFSKGFYGSLAYTYTYGVDVTANPGSQASSVWAINATSRTQNDLEVYNSSFAVPHRIVGTLSYRTEYLKHLASTFTFFYEGATQGRYSYIYNGDINNDGNSADLMYIPKNTSEMNFSAIAASGTTPAFTPAQQAAAFDAYIAQDPYLSKHRGQNAERNGAMFPFYHRVDFNFLQDIFTNVGKYKNTLQFNMSVVNFLNLLNPNWGIRKATVVNNPLRVISVTGGVPVYQLATYTPLGATAGQLVDRTFINVNSTSTTWGIQMGLKYIF